MMYRNHAYEYRFNRTFIRMQTQLFSFTSFVSILNKNDIGIPMINILLDDKNDMIRYQQNVCFVQFHDITIH